MNKSSTGLLPGFEEATSANLPVIQYEMIDEFYLSNSYFKNDGFIVKTKSSKNATCPDEVIGYVQLKRESNLCTIHGIVTPEYCVPPSEYRVITVINETEDHPEIIESKCMKCISNKDGCKHAIDFLFWLYRRSLTSSETTISYWRKSTLSQLGSASKDLSVANIFKISPEPLPSDGENSFLDEVVNYGLTYEIDSVLLDYFRNSASLTEKFSLYHLHLNYAANARGILDAGTFIKFCKENMNSVLSQEASKQTKKQAKDNKWFDLRFGRITASKFYDAAHCKTPDDAMIDGIMGSSKFEQRDKGGNQLKDLVLNSVATQRNIKINQIGFCISPRYPIFGASPDGVSEEFCIEVKSPTNSTLRNYLPDGQITMKLFAQMQLEMLLCNRKKSLICIASPQFQENKEVTNVEIKYDEKYCMNLMTSATEFWKKQIYPVLSN